MTAGADGDVRLYPGLFDDETLSVPLGSKITSLAVNVSSVFSSFFKVRLQSSNPDIDYFTYYFSFFLRMIWLLFLMINMKSSLTHFPMYIPQFYLLIYILDYNYDII